KVETDSKSGKPVKEIKLTEARVLVDPFEAFLREEQEGKMREEEKRKGGRGEDEKVTWTGKRVRGDGSIEGKDGEMAGVGRYLKSAGGQDNNGTVVMEEWEGDAEEQPKLKKLKAGGGGFGNFDSW
ncbi:MAG: hypothetical protein L6R35_007362, partial [Caloplaca aegaea]